MSLPDALEAAASALPDEAESIRPANGDPLRLLDLLSREGAARVLGWLLVERADAGEELAEAWVEEQGGVAAVLGVDEQALPKAGRKALRRARHRLRSRGVAVEEPTPKPRVATLPAIEDSFESAWVSPLDPSGVRLVYQVEANPSGGARIFEIVVDDGRGVVGFEVYAAPRKKARAFLGDLKSRERFPVVEVSRSAARAVVAHALARQDQSRPAPRSFFEWKSRLAQEEPAELPGAAAREALGEEVARTLLDRAAELVKDGRIGPWPPGGEMLSSLFERIRTAMGSPLVVSQAAKREQLDSLLGDALEEIFVGPGAELAAHRLRESAFVLWRHDDEEAARACLAGARAMEDGSPRENPLARAMLETALGPALDTLEATAKPEAEKESDEGSLLVKP